jgi:hypothetical protein
MSRILRPILILVTMLSLTLFAQDRFDRLATIDAMPEDIGGFGNIVAGVDLDNDGFLEVYVVNSDWHDQIGLDLIPRIYKYEDGPNGWDIVWSTRLPLEFQNTWPALTWGDLDQDGKGEVIWGPVNNLGGGLQPNPDRIVVFETAGDGSNNMGVDNGDGTYRPNARWTITSAANANIRPFRWYATDIDGDNTTEIVAFCRAGDGIQIYSVSDVPDAADSTETWTLEYSGVTGTFYDGFVIGNTAYGIQSNGDIQSVSWDGFAYVQNPTQAGMVGGGSWNSAQVVDIDGDSQQEVLVASWSSSTSNVYLLQQSGDSLISTLLYDVPDEAFRLYGGAAGDLDGDGLLDFGFGTRQAVPNGSIYRLEYQGGAIDDGANYVLQLVDAEVSDAVQYDILAMADLTGDGKDEFLYTGTPRGLGAADPPQPIVILTQVHMNAPVILAVDDVPNDQGRNVWVVWQGAADDVGGLRFTAELSGDNQPTPVVTSAYGKVTFTLDETNNTLHYLLKVYNIVDVTAAHIHVGGIGVSGGVTAFLYSGTPGGAVNGVLANGVITEADLIGDFAGNFDGFKNALLSGGLYVNVHTSANAGGEIRGQILTDPSSTVPVATNGYQIEKYVVWRIDAGVPVQVAEVQAIQSPVYAAVVPTLGDGPDWEATYVVSSHTSDVLVNWKSLPKIGVSIDNLIPTAPGNLATTLQDGKVLLTWDESPDPDFNYFSILRSDQPGFDPNTADEIGTTVDPVFLDENVQPGETWYYRVVAYDFNANKGEFSDEVFASITGIDDNITLPTEFALEQNYPNPFNPSTTIEFALPQAVDVSLKIFNIRGQLVKTLVSGNKAAGRYSLTWDGTDNFGNKVASGTYIYAIKAGNFVQNKKMILLK